MCNLLRVGVKLEMRDGPFGRNWILNDEDECANVSLAIHHRHCTLKTHRPLLPVSERAAVDVRNTGPQGIKPADFGPAFRL
jgi:hypothetical protein